VCGSGGGNSLGLLGESPELFASRGVNLIRAEAKVPAIMRAITIAPGVAHSARLDEWPEPPLSDGAVLAQTIALGVCGTDREMVAGHYGAAPQGSERLILGHESLGRVVSAPQGCGLAPGDLVVGIVRRPDPVPCPACAAGEWDMCRNGRYTERGIKERHGFGADFFRIEPEFAIPIDGSLGLLGVLLEPASIAAKAWDHTERIGRRARAWPARRLLVTGAGPIGLLCALIGAQRGFELHVLDRNPGGLKERLVRALGGSFHAGELRGLRDLAPDVIMECTGAPAVVRDLFEATGPAAIVCLLGVSEPGALAELDLGAINRRMVLNNDAVFGAVNANRRHYELACEALMRAPRGWLEQLITRRVPAERWAEALEHRAGDIKVVVEFTRRPG
jgi:threonine dehydrogenase-like Zn-dependent dehydrogenase